MNVRRMLVMSGACGVLASTISTALAQEKNEVSEVVIVTGSYIRGTPEDAALPVDVISSDDLEKQGAPSTLELIKSLSYSAGVLGDTNQFDARAQGSEGSGSVNLRGFGPERTLVLLNGRRLATNPFVGGSIDTNIIPSAAIGRVEVLKDGAAATYGSDAIAGVVNFITKENLNGLDLGADYKAIEDSDGDYNVSASYGWQGDRMDVLLSAGYQHRSELMVKDRDWATPDYLVSPQSGWSASGNPSTIISLSPTFGVTGLFRDPQCANLGGFPGFVPGATSTAAPTPVCNWQYTPFDALTEKEDRFQVFGSMNFDITDSMTLHAEGLYSETDVPIYRTSPSYAGLQTPGSLATGGTSPAAGRYYVPPTNPGLIDFVAQNPGMPSMAGGAFIAANRPFAIGGNPLFGYGSSQGPRHYEAYRGSIGLNGEIGESFGWDVAVTYSEEKATREGRDTAVNRYQLALRGLGGPGCNVAANTPGANGCFWLNPFSNAIPANAITGQANGQFRSAVANENLELIDWMFPVVSTEQTSSLLVVDAVVNGELGLKLPGGNIGWALGGQYRDDGFKTWYSDLSNLDIVPCVNAISTGIVGPSACTPTEIAAGAGGFVFLGGGYNVDLSSDVYAAFMELSLPLADNFQAQIAARYEDYGGNVGSTFDPKVSLRWQVVDSFALRGSVGSTFRGPPPNRLYPGTVTTLQSIAGTFRAIREAGNPDLEPEEAFTFNVGMLIGNGGFRASVDYWNYDFDKPIVREPVAGIVSKVFPNGNNLPNNCADPAMAPLVARFTFQDGVCSTANIARLDIQWINGPGVETSGVDITLDYLWEDVAGGDIEVGVAATHVFEYKVAPAIVSGIEVSGATDAVGQLNYQTTAYPLPQWKGNVYLQYSIGRHNIRWMTNYIDDYTDQRNDIYQPSPATNTGGDTYNPANNIAILGGKVIDSFMTHDLFYRVELPWEVALNLSVENLTDEDPPFARLDLAYDPFTASAFGRIYKVGLRKRFSN